MWDPTTYLAFAGHRERPFHDLLARVGATDPRQVVDLGCGPGQLTPVLSHRWPAAKITALDSSAEMVEAARVAGIDAALTDVRDWQPDPDTDVVICNAVLQWVNGHLDLLPAWLDRLPAGAWFAFQVPGNFAEPSHTIPRGIAESPAWRDTLGGTFRPVDAVPRPEVYAGVLAAAGFAADVWETTYLHELRGADPVLNWISGTALRPVRAALDETRWPEFTAELAPRLRAAYPAHGEDVTWFPMRRIFAVGHKK
ncbi:MULTISPECIES: trans-aconitate 2-methyltransferase [unclassified Crossiella]|uniref:trans-aconitate 2-methyltransferase n=1 Tax=unclassified Crossiella TaxID=2620835 RepID=UPI001FFFE78E|nr:MULTISPECIES: trans-aconitate 2-methyltransferase [unclassified Crossiella]MCK2241011.1 trans-aconitate 2-methyltransferase [Crossiella sp. S99.2]MCK2253845.1 trans-aconitate 2-methyltransferase [Crossiella sp. S99.1]